MNELGFAVGANQSFKALINIYKKSNWKVIQGRQK